MLLFPQDVISGPLTLPCKAARQYVDTLVAADSGTCIGSAKQDTQQCLAVDSWHCQTC